MINNESSNWGSDDDDNDNDYDEDDYDDEF